MTDIEQRIFRIVTGTRVQSDIPGAILADIERTHAMIPKEELLHTYTVLMAAGKTREAARLQAIWTKEPIRHDAANCDTPETT